MELCESVVCVVDYDKQTVTDM